LGDAVNQRPPDDGARGDPGTAGSGPAPEIADLDSSFDLSAFAPETLRQPVPGTGEPRPRVAAGSPLGLSGILEPGDPAGPPRGRPSGVGLKIPPALAGLWDRPERAVAAAGALVILLALAIAVVALGREGEPSAAALAGAPEAPVATAGTPNASPDAPTNESARSAAKPAAAATVAANAPGVSRSVRENDARRRVAASAPPRRRAGNATSIGTAGTETHGWVALRAPIPVEMWEDGRLVGRAGARVRLPAGRHVVDLVNEQLNYRERRSVAVAAGATSQLRLDVPRGSISLNAIPWAAVWIDGRRVGDTPLGELPVALGEHVIRFEHPHLGERRETVLVKAGEVTRVSVNLRQ
jgi:hypothetical protein